MGWRKQILEPFLQQNLQDLVTDGRWEWRWRGGRCQGPSLGNTWRAVQLSERGMLRGKQDSRASVGWDRPVLWSKDVIGPL